MGTSSWCSLFALHYKTMPISARPTVFALAFLLALSLLPVDAQDHRATLRGVIVDPAFRGLPQVELKATQEETGDVRRTTTDSRGRFTMPELPAGMYRVNVEHSGF